MKKTYQTINGEKFTAADTAALVRRLRKESRSGPEVSEREWMRGVALRIHASSGKRVRANSAENFVSDLIRSGFLQEVSKV